MSHLKNITLFFVLSACLVGWRVPAYAEDGVRSNLEILTELATEAADELISGFQPELKDRSGVRLVPYADGQTYEFLVNIFTTELTSRGIRTYTAGPAAAKDSSAAVQGKPAAMDLSIQAIEFSLIYPDIFRPHLIGGRKVKRMAEINLFAKLIDTSDRSVAWVGEASRVYDDQFSYGDRAQVEKSLFDFTKPEMEPTNWGRIVEPVVVSGIIVGLVYLFFSNQNNN